MIKDQERARTTRDLGFPEGVENMLDEIMEYEPEVLVPNIDNHIFDTSQMMETMTTFQSKRVEYTATYKTLLS